MGSSGAAPRFALERGSILHPPLSFYLQSIPLWFADIDTGVFELASSRGVDPAELAKAAVSRGQALLSSPANQDDRLLTASRFVMVATGALLGWFVYAWSHALYGPWSAMLAVALYTFCPNILAHSALASWSIHPHYRAYFNELIGGPGNGYRYLVDSNLDWGQGLKGPRRFMQANAIPEISLGYFGTRSSPDADPWRRSATASSSITATSRAAPASSQSSPCQPARQPCRIR